MPIERQTPSGIILRGNPYEKFSGILTLTVPYREDILIRTDQPVTKEDFLKDNQAELAKGEKGKIGRWFLNYQAGKIFLRVGCSDARPIYDEERVWNQRSVAGAFPNRTLYNPVYLSGAFEGIVVGTHYGNFELGKRPTGCGGQDTKAAIRSGRIRRAKDGIIGFVDNGVHEDPIINGIIQARDIVDHLDGKDGKVFVVTQDHRTGEIIPVAEYVIKHGIENRQIPLEFRPFLKASDAIERERIYMPNVVYSHGIPHLDEPDLSPEFKEYLAITRAKQLEISAINRDLSQRQKIQNPWALVISANKIPIQDRYPTLFGGIGSAFEVDIPRLKSERIVTIAEEAIGDAIDQMQFAMERANDINDPSFSKSKTLLIETGSYHQSLRIAKALFEKDFALKWAELDGQVFVAQTCRGGETDRIEPFIPATKTA